MKTCAALLLLASAAWAADAPRPSAERIARAEVLRQAAPAGELAHVATTTGQGGVRFVTFEQRFGDVVAGSRTTIAIDADGRIVATRLGRFARARPVALDRAVGLPDVGRAVEALGLTGADGSPLRASSEPPEAVLLPGELAAEPALRVRVRPDGDRSAVEDLYLSTLDGRLLRRESAHFDAIATIRSCPLDPAQGFVLASTPDPSTLPSVHSPLGWADGLETSGNNVRVVLDRDGLADPDGPRAIATGDPATLDFPFTGDPIVDTDAALANVFWAINDAHDRFRALGLDEPTGAMQQDAFGRGGVAGDRMVAFVQSASIDGQTPTNVFRSAIAADGGAATMTMGLFRVPTTNEIRDPAFDTDLIYHEYSHAVLARVLGDAACFNGQHPRGLTEGWADFFAASFTDDDVIGGWTRDEFVNGMRSSSLDANTYSFANFCLDGCNPNRNGEIWAGLLWDIRRFLIARLGQAEGVKASEQLAFEALRYLPCTPTFLDARDAVLLAEDAMFGGALHCDFWTLFVQRGLGAEASATGPGDTLPLAGFTMPPECRGAASIDLDAAEYGAGGEMSIVVLDAAPPPTPRVTVTTTGGDTESVDLAGAIPYLRATLPLFGGVAVPFNGILEVADGDTITATYDPRGISATASVSADAAVGTILHLVLGSACQADDDHASAPNFFFLPGFLDAGEAADILLAGISGAAGPLRNATVEVSSLNPHVSVTPAGPIPLGTIAPAPEGGYTVFTFTISAAATPDVIPGETAELVLQYRADGRSAENRYTLVLSQDYELVTGQSPFENGIETFETDSPTTALWTHQANAPGPDAWRLEACAADVSSRGYANDSPGCASYPDNQGAPSLVSPVLVPTLPADTVAFRITDLAWRHRAVLYSDPVRIGCERDVVATFLTTDPATIPYSDPLSVVSGAFPSLRVMTSAQNTGVFADAAPATAQTGAVYLQPGAPTGGQRLAWVFWSDASDPLAPGCIERVNDGTYSLDHVRFAYEYVRQVPEATPCAGECKVLLRASVVPDEPLCPGSAFEIDATGSSIAGCGGPPTYSFTGPGVPPAFASTTLSRAPALYDGVGPWSVTLSCETGPLCSATLDGSPLDARSGARGWTLDETLRARRSGDDVELAWIAASDPSSHGAWRATTRAQIAAPIAAWDLVSRADGESLAGEVVAVVPGAALEPGLACYRVAPRDPCSDAPR